MEEHMKTKKIILVALLLIMAMLFQVGTLAAETENDYFRNNNVVSTSTSFSISNNGMANVNVKYIGVSGITTGASISVVIKKVVFLWFTSTIIDETYNIADYSYSNTYTYDLSSNGSGTYKCFVTYTVSGSGGPDDVIPFEDTESY